MVTASGAFWFISTPSSVALCISCGGMHVDRSLVQISVPAAVTAKNMPASVANKMLKTKIVQVTGSSESRSASNRVPGSQGELTRGQRIAVSLLEKQVVSLFRRCPVSSFTPRTSLMIILIVAVMDSWSFEVRLVTRSDNPVEAREAAPRMANFRSMDFQHDMVEGRVHRKLQRALMLLHLPGRSPSGSSVWDPRAVVAINPVAVAMQQTKAPTKVTQCGS